MRLENYCMMSESDLMVVLGNMPGAVSKNGYVFVDNSADVLAVCHADVSGAVVHDMDFAEAYSNRGRHFVTSGALDDRLGIWSLIEIISKRVNVDILITTGEEIGASTAFEFSLDYPDRRWNWIVEFDRRGTDYVMYDYHNASFDKAMKKCGFKKGHGSFSDICLLDGYGVVGFNVGIGYHNEHHKNCYADIDDTMDQVRRFLKFYRAYSGKRFSNQVEKFSYYDIEERYEGYRGPGLGSYGEEQSRFLWDDWDEISAYCVNDVPASYNGKRKEKKSNARILRG